MWSGRPVTSAAATKKPSAAAAGASRRRWATQAAATSAASGGTASAASARCAVCSDKAPETTASAAPAAVPTAIRRSQKPGRTSGIGLLKPATNVPQRSGAGHVRDLVEIVRRRGRARVPLERVAEPGIVAGAPADPRRPDDVDQEHERPERHHERADRRDEVPGGPPAVVVIGPDPPRHSEHSEEVLREEGEVDPDEV